MQHITIYPIKNLKKQDKLNLFTMYMPYLFPIKKIRPYKVPFHQIIKKISCLRVVKTEQISERRIIT